MLVVRNGTLATNSANHKCSCYALVAWLVLRFEHGRQLLDQPGFASFGFKEAPVIWPMTVPVTYRNKIIFISSQLVGPISMQSFAEPKLLRGLWQGIQNFGWSYT